MKSRGLFILAVVGLFLSLSSINAAADTWIQTTQEDFESGTLENLDTTSSPGDVKLKLLEDWTVDYTADALPEDSDPAWIADYPYNGSVSDGILTMSDYLHYTQNDVMGPNSGGNIAEVKLKTIQSTGWFGFHLHFRDGTKEARFRIFEDKVDAWNGSENITYYMDTTDDYHIYRMLLKGTEAELYVDGVKRLSWAAVVADPWSPNRIQIYQRQGGISKIDYVKYYTGGAIPPWTVDYTADALPEDSEPVWTGYETEDASVDGGLLTVVAAPNSASHYKRRDVLSSNATGNTGEIRMKIISGGPGYFTLRDGTKWQEFWIGTTYVGSTNGTYYMDTTGGYHIYSITLKENIVKIYVDGIERISGSPASGEENYVCFGMGGALVGGRQAKIDYARYYTGGAIPPGGYLSPGILTSSIYDADSLADWGTISWTDDTSAQGTSVKFRTRTSPDGSSWSAWSDYYTTSGSPITSPSSRWIQYEATLETTDPQNTPILNDVTISYTTNTPPVAGNLKISPESPKTNDNLVGSYDYSDADGDPESGSEIRWYKDDVLQPAYNDQLTIPFSATTKGEVWHFTVRPKDGIDFGELKTSPSVTILNSAPSAPNLDSPQDGTLTKDNTPTLTWNNATDPDNDTLTYALEVDTSNSFDSPNKRAYSNIAEGIDKTSKTIPEADTLTDGTWYWRVSAKDGTVDGPWSATWSFILDATPPSVDTFSLDDRTSGSTQYTNDATVDVVMTESDAGTGVEYWLINESSTTPSVSDFSLTARPTSYTMSAGDGEKTVYAWVMDYVQNISLSKSHTITLDITPPSDPTGFSLKDQTSGSTLYTNAALVDVTATASGYNYYILNETDSTQPLETDSDWTSGAIPSTYTLSTGDSSKTAYLWLKDAVGNINPGPAVSDAITLNTTAPANPTLSITDLVTGSTLYTNVRTVSATISGEAVDVVEWLLSESQSTKPLETDPNWESPEPTSFGLQDEDGLRTVYCWIKDEAGNINVGVVSDTITLDRVKPVVDTFSLDDRTSGSTQYTNDATVDVIMTESDTETGVEYWLINESSTTPSPGDFSLTERPASYTLSAGDGSKTVYAWVMDYVQNISLSKSHTITLDTTPPSPPDATKLIVAQNPPGTPDAISGLAGAVEADSTVKVYSDAELTKLIDSTTANADGSFTAISIGDNLYGTVWVTATDAAGNESTATSKDNDIVAPDAPIVDPPTSPTNVTPITVTGNAEAGSTVEVFVNGVSAGTTTATGAGTFSLPNVALNEGINSITATAKDAVGNISSPSTPKTVVLDTILPEIEITSPTEGLITNQDVTLAYTVSDNVSTPEDIVLTGDESPYTTEGVHKVTLTATDEAGNSATDTVNFLIDKTKPEIEITSPTEGLITNQDVTLAYTVTDNVSEPGDITVTGDDSPYTEEGVYNITLTATDEAGNTATDTVSFTIDTTLPTNLSLTIDEGDYTNTAAINLTIGATGASQMYIDGDVVDDANTKEWIAYATAKSVALTTGDGSKTVTIKFKDEAGNETSPVSDTITLDTTAPTGSISINNNDDATTSTLVTLTLSATDTGSGMGTGAQMKLSNDGSSWEPAEDYHTSRSWLLTSGDGIKTVYVKFKDVAGNWSSVYSNTIILNTTGRVLWMHMDEASWNGTPEEVIDSSGQNNHGTAKNGASTTADGVSGRAGSFDGTNDYVDCGDIDDIDNATKLTIEMWVKPDRVDIRQATITKWVGTGKDIGQLGAWWSDLYNEEVSGTCVAGQFWTTTDVNLTAGNWYHIVQVFDGSQSGNANRYKAYVNGVQKTVNFGTYTVPAQLGDEGTQTVNIGTYESGKELFFDGLIDEVAIYNQALSAEEIAEIYEAGYDIDGDGLLDEWEMQYFGNLDEDGIGDYDGDGYTNLEEYQNGTDPTDSDVTPPTGSISINSGATYTTSTSVILTLSAHDSGSGVSQMKFSNDGSSWESAEDYHTSWFWLLTPGDDGERTVYVKFKDAAGNWSDAYSNTIILDTTLPVGHVLWMHLDEASWNGTPEEVIDSSGQGNHGTAENGANTTADGVLNRAGEFDGVDDYVNLSNPSSLQPSGAYTISAWVYREGDGTGVFNGIATTCKKTAGLNRGQNGYSLLYYPDGNVVRLYHDEDGDGDWKYAESNGDLTPNTWYYLTAVWENPTITLYINGIAQTTTGSANKITYHASTESAIGQYWWNGGEGFFNGIIDEVAIYNRALSAEEIAELYETGL